MGIICPLTPHSWWTSCQKASIRSEGCPGWNRVNWTFKFEVSWSPPSPLTNNISELHLRKCTSPMDLEPPLHQGHFVFQIWKIKCIQSFSVSHNQLICLIILFLCLANVSCRIEVQPFFKIGVGWIFTRYLGRDDRDMESSAPCKRKNASISDCFWSVKSLRFPNLSWPKWQKLRKKTWLMFDYLFFVQGIISCRRYFGAIVFLDELGLLFLKIPWTG